MGVDAKIKAPKISIAMATYNGEKYLREQLESFTAQTRLPDELVACDDCSSDGTVAILEQFAASAPFEVRIERNEETLGFAQNFSKAMSLCSGDVIFLSDQDDWWFPDKIAVQARYLEEHASCMVVICDQEICDAALERSGRTKLGNILDAGYNETQFITGCCMAIRRQFLEIALPVPDQEPAHDSWIGRLSDAIQTKHVLAQPLQLYRRHDNNASQWAMSQPVKPTKVTTLGTIKTHGLRSAHDGWRQEAIVLKSTIDRFQWKEHQHTNCTLKEFYQTALSRLEAMAANLERRIAITSRPRVTRWPSVVAFWIDGGYRQFSGWKSAAKDIMRP